MISHGLQIETRTHGRADRNYKSQAIQRNSMQSTIVTKEKKRISSEGMKSTIVPKAKKRNGKKRISSELLFTLLSMWFVVSFFWLNRLHTIQTTAPFSSVITRTKREVLEELARNKFAIPTPRQALEETCCYCCHDGECPQDLIGNFVGDGPDSNATRTKEESCNSSYDLVRVILDRLKEKLPFAWIRWGDGEMIQARAESEYGQKLRDSLFFLSRNEYAILNVGMGWAKGNFKKQWNGAFLKVPSNESESNNMRKSIFHNHFYLPIGDPVSMPRLVGWANVLEKVQYKIVLIGPKHLTDLPFLSPDFHIDAMKLDRNLPKTLEVVKTCKDLIEQQQFAVDHQPLLFMCAAGFSSKIIIAELLAHTQKYKNMHIQSYIDVGASLDGFVGVKSRDYNSPSRYCTEVIKNGDPDNRYHWMKKGVCEDKYWKDYNFTSSQTITS